MNNPSRQLSDQEPSDDADPPPPFPPLSAGAPSIDDALRLMPPTLASDARAAASTALPANFPLPVDDLHDLTADLSIQTPADLEIFLDTEYIQLPDNPTLDLSHDDYQPHDSNNRNIPAAPMDSSTLQLTPKPDDHDDLVFSNTPPSHPPEQPQQNPDPRPDTHTETLVRLPHEQNTLVPVSAQPPTSPTLAASSPLTAQVSSDAPEIGPVKQTKASVARRSRLNSGPTKRPRPPRTTQGNNGNLASGAQPIRIAPRRFNVSGLSPSANEQCEAALGPKSHLSDIGDQQNDRTDSNHGKVHTKTPPKPSSPQKQLPFKMQTVPNSPLPQTATLPVGQMPIVVPHGTSNLIPIIPNMYPMTSVMFPMQSSSPQRPGVLQTPMSQQLQQGQAQLQSEYMNRNVLQQQQQQSQILKSSNVVSGRSETQPQSLTQLQQSPIASPNAATAAAAAQFPHDPNAAAAAAAASAAAPDARLFMVQSGGLGTGTGTSAGMSTATMSMPHAAHLPNFLNLNVPMTPSEAHAQAAASTVAAFQPQAQTNQSTLRTTQDVQQQTAPTLQKSTLARTQTRQPPHLSPSAILGQSEPQQQHQGHVLPGAVPIAASPVHFDPTNFYFSMAAHQYALQLPGAVNGHFPMGPNSSTATMEAGGAFGTASSDSNQIRTQNVCSDSLTLQPNVGTNPQTSLILPGAQQQLMHHLDQQANIVTDGMHRNFLKQPAARLDRHPILGRLQLTSSSKPITKHTSTATNASYENERLPNSSIGGGSNSTPFESTSGEQSGRAGIITGNSGQSGRNLNVPNSSLNSLATVINKAAGNMSSVALLPKHNNTKSSSTKSGKSGVGSSKNEARMQKKRLVWTPELHERFIIAIEEVGLAQAVPKTLVMIMNVEGLTTEHVKSHLQKYRNSLRKEADEEAKEHAEAMVTSKIQSRYLTSNTLSNLTQASATFPGTTTPTATARADVSEATPTVNVERNASSNAEPKQVAKNVTALAQPKQQETNLRYDEVPCVASTPIPTQRTGMNAALSSNLTGPALTILPGTSIATSTVTAANMIPPQPTAHTSANISNAEIIKNAIPSSNTEAQSTRDFARNNPPGGQDTGLATSNSKQSPTEAKTAQPPVNLTVPNVSAALSTPTSFKHKANAIVSRKPSDRTGKRDESENMALVTKREGLDEAEEGNEEDVDAPEAELNQEQKDLEIELIKEKLLQMQLQLQKMVHRTVTLDRQHQRDCQRRQREEAKKREGSERSGRSNHGAQTEKLSNRSGMDVAKADDEIKKEEHEISAAAAINNSSQTMSTNDEQLTTGIKRASEAKETERNDGRESNDENEAANRPKRRRVAEGSSELNQAAEAIDATRTEITPTASADAKAGETEYEQLLRQQLEMGEKLQAQHALLNNHLGRVTMVDAHLKSEPASAVPPSTSVTDVAVSKGPGSEESGDDEGGSGEAGSDLLPQAEGIVMDAVKVGATKVS